ncbi:MAG: SLATT domain-containing protein [Pyrinomonadaceae bacterium]
MTTDERTLLENWEKDTKKIYRAQYDSSVRAQNLNLYLGIPTVILSAIVGTSVFAMLGKTPGNTSQIAVGIISMVVTALASLQTFLRFSERGERHQATAAGFAALNREARNLLASPPADDKETKERLRSFRERWDELSKNAPTAFKSSWNLASRRREEDARPE